MNAAYQTAVICGALPLIAGTAIFLAWTISPEGWVLLAGVLVVLAGSVLVVIGFVSLCLYARLAKGIGPRPRSLRRPAMLLIANFPVCAVYVFVALTVEAANFFTVDNRLRAPIQKLTLTDAAGRSISLSLVATGARACAHFREGPLNYSIIVENEERSGVLTGYVTGMESFVIEVTEGPRVSFRTLMRDRPRSVKEYLRYCLFQ